LLRHLPSGGRPSGKLGPTPKGIGEYMLQEVSPEKLIVRWGEDDRKFIARSDRFFTANGHWFFQTRGGCVTGPFISQKNAAKGLDLHILDLLERNLILPI